MSFLHSWFAHAQSETLFLQQNYKYKETYKKLTVSKYQNFTIKITDHQVLASELAFVYRLCAFLYIN